MTWLEKLNICSMFVVCTTTQQTCNVVGNMAVCFLKSNNTDLRPVKISNS